MLVWSKEPLLPKKPNKPQNKEKTTFQSAKIYKTVSVSPKYLISLHLLLFILVQMRESGVLK